MACCEHTSMPHSQQFLRARARTHGISSKTSTQDSGMRCAFAGWLLYVPSFRNRLTSGILWLGTNYLIPATNRIHIIHVHPPRDYRRSCSPFRYKSLLVLATCNIPTASGNNAYTPGKAFGCCGFGTKRGLGVDSPDFRCGGLFLT